MNKKRSWVLVFTGIAVISILVFLGIRGMGQSTDVSKTNTQERIHELEKQYKKKEVLILFKESASDEDIERIIADVKGEVIDSMKEIKNYRIEIKDAKGISDLMLVIETLSQNPLVEMADLNEVASSVDQPSLDNPEEASIAFEQALSIYNKEAAVHTSKDQSYTFLFPADWKQSTEHMISESQSKKGVAFTSEYSKQAFFDDKVDVFLKKDEEAGFVFDGVADRYERDGLIISRYEVKKTGKTYYKGFIQAQDTFFVFKPSDNVTIDEFSLILDSFLYQK